MAGLTRLNPEELRQFSRRWERLFNDGDYREIAAHYTQDAHLIATGFPTAIGPAAIAEFWRAATAALTTARARRTVRVDHLEQSDSLAYVRGVVEVTTPGAATKVSRYVTVWRRDTDEYWRLAIDISNDEPNTA
jgi:ketosteroid isomerase-like protein